ncbi:MAG: GTPase Era [Pseudomonadota bacterium]
MQTNQINADPASQKCAIIAVIGAPNAGKSSFVNAMVGQKIAIVTHKVQTTRTRVRGLSISDNTQLIFVDTPGIFEPKRRLDRAMVSAAWDALDGADEILFMIDAPSYRAGSTMENADGAARRAAQDTETIIDALAARDLKPLLLVNKIDKLAREQTLPIIQRVNDRLDVSETFLISATRGDDLDVVRDHLLSVAPEGPWLFPEDQLSDISDRLLAAEVTREKIFLRLHQELPYETTVETESWTRMKTGDLRVEQVIYVSRAGHKGIVLGAKGQTLKSIGQAARTDLSEILGEKVHLFLHVRVRENWADEAARYRAMGLAFET